MFKTGKCQNFYSEFLWQTGIYLCMFYRYMSTRCLIGIFPSLANLTQANVFSMVWFPYRDSLQLAHTAFIALHPDLVVV